jgi:hypothetical protein
MVYFPALDNSEVLSLDLIKNIVENKFNCNLKRLKEFSRFDLKDKDNKIIVEVKKRYNTHDKYNTTMIGYNKYDRAEHYYKKGYTVLFCFVFTDGNYYYKFNNDKNLKPKIGGRCDRGIKEFKEYIYIPIDELEKFN